MIHSANRARDYEKYGDQKMQTPTRVQNSGLEATKYKIRAVKDFKINDAQFTILDVELECNKTSTPWCMIY